MDTIEKRLQAVKSRIARACAAAGRDPRDIVLVAVSKTFPADAVRAAYAAGLRHFRENKVQEAEGKLGALEDLHAAGAVWHLVGHLQGNKARKAAQLFDRIHSLDSLALGERLARLASEGGRRVSALVQVDLAGEAAKFGLPEAELLVVLERLRALPGLSPRRAEGAAALVRGPKGVSHSARCE